MLTPPRAKVLARVLLSTTRSTHYTAYRHPRRALIQFLVSSSSSSTTRIISKPAGARYIARVFSTTTGNDEMNDNINNNGVSQEDLDREAAENRQLEFITPFFRNIVEELVDGRYSAKTKHFKEHFHEYNVFRRAILCASLNSLVLQKYRDLFNVDDFLVGAQQAFLQCCKALGSDDFEAYCDG
jgi:hypothetical protein